MKSEKKSKSKIFFLVLVFISLINSVAIINVAAENHEVQPMDIKNQNSKSPNDWTFMVYLDADNNLEQDAINDFMEMEFVGSSPNIHIVVQFDRTPGYASSYDDWTTTKRYYITSGITPSNADALVDLGEINMGLASSLSDFIIWGTTNYPSDHYALILWNHGSGWKSDNETPDPLFKGVCYDDTDGDYLDNIELKNALATADVYFDLIAFDACLMAMTEIDYQIKDWAQVRVASEEVVPLDGFPYDTILTHLKADPTMAAFTLGYTMVDDYIAYYGTSGTESLSAVDLTQEGTLATAIDTLSLELISQIGIYFNEIKDARLASDSTYDPDFIDLYDFAYEINNRISDINIQNAAQDVMNSLLLMNINEAHGTGHPDFHGTSIYYPTASGGYYPTYETTLDFTAAFSWDEFLQAYYLNFPDDNYEENDDYTTAYDLSAYENTWLSTIDGLGIQADDDWYEIYMSSGELFLQVELLFTHSEGDIDIDVYDSSLTWIAGSYSVTDNEYINVLVPSAGTYYLCIYLEDAGNEYDLWWDDTIPPSDDNYEENDDYTTAYDLSAYEDTWLSSIDGPGVQYDQDWYEIYIDPGDQRLLVTLTFTHADGNLEIGVYDSNLNLVVYNISTTDNEYIDFIVPSSGTHYLLIIGEDRGNEYDLWWNDVSGIPIDDNYEENDDYSTAY
ncbi:MAG: clostripain-related cysteine peptidase, partial [Promethearchaeota archaeon]